MPWNHAARVAASIAASLATAAAAALLAPPLVAAAAPVPQLPDLETVIPTGSLSVLTTDAGREFRYTHLVFNSGPGPLEVRPDYDPASGQFHGTQEIYAKDTDGSWSLSSTHRVADIFAFHPEHGHFHFPLASFGLYSVAADGGPGAPVAMSPKVGFCIDDSFIYDATVPNAGTFVGIKGSCSDPTSLRGMTVGAVDEYDYRDPGQSIPIDGVPDGTYWFRAVSDPNNDFREADETDNETDVKVTISAGKVTTGAVRHPDTSPPTGDLVSPAAGSSVSGTWTLQASAPSGVVRVDYLVDGAVVGSVANPPYSLAWDSPSVVDGAHWLAARYVDGLGRVGTSPVNVVTVDNSGSPPSSSGLSVGGSTSADGQEGTVTTEPLMNLAGGERLLCFVSSDGPAASAQTAAVTGGGLTWSLVRRANGQAGTAEVWTAVLPRGQTSVAATSTQAHGPYHQSVTLTAFEHSAGVGAASGNSAATGAPGTTLSTTSDGSFVLGAGNDWDGAVPRLLGTGQTLVHQWVDSTVGDTFWVQRRTAAVADAGTAVTIDDTSPTTHSWNLVAVEVRATPTSQTDDAAPVVAITDPAAGDTVSGTVQLAATAADNVGVVSVQFRLDGNALGPPATTPPFMTPWDTTTAAPGSHTLTAVATDAAGNQGTSAPVAITVDNSAPPPAKITIDTKVGIGGRSRLRSPLLSTTARGDVLVAFVAMDGPAGARAQRATVAGAGLTWRLVKRSNSQSGDSEIWAAVAPTRLTNVTVSATPLRTGYDGLLTVIAFKNAAGTNIASAAGAPRGAPSIYLPGTAAGSWAFAVGNDWDRAVARTPAAGQVLQRQRVDTNTGNTFWVQSTRAPNTLAGLVTLADTAPTNDQWNLAAVEVVAKPAA